MTVYENNDTADALVVHVADSTGSQPLVISVNGNLGGFMGLDVTATSDSSQNTSSQATLQINATFTNYTGSGDVLHVVASDNFSFPSGSHYALSNSESSSAIGNGSAGGAYTHQTAATLGSYNVQTPPTSGGGYTTVQSPSLTISPTTTNSTESPVAFAPTLPYTLVGSLAITMNAGLSLNVNVTGSSALMAVPEPSSVVLLGLGSVGAIGLLRRRRRSRANVVETDPSQGQ